MKIHELKLRGKEGQHKLRLEMSAKHRAAFSIEATIRLVHGHARRLTLEINNQPCKLSYTSGDQLGVYLAATDEDGNVDKNYNELAAISLSSDGYAELPIDCATRRHA